MKKKKSFISFQNIQSEKKKSKCVPPSEKRSSYPIFNPSQVLGGWLGLEKIRQFFLKKEINNNFDLELQHTNRQLHGPAF